MLELHRVLIVDDDAAVRRFMRTCLERNGYQVLEADNCEDALATYREHNPGIHLLITDIRMPGMDGNELARRIHEENSSQRILFVTAFPGDVNHTVLPSDALAKPFSASVFLRKVTAQLARAVGG